MLCGVRMLCYTHTYVCVCVCVCVCVWCVCVCGVCVCDIRTLHSMYVRGLCLHSKPNGYYDSSSVYCVDTDPLVSSSAFATDLNC